MRKKRKTVSIIIVHYKADREFFACLQSIISSKPKTSYEIIVVDNDGKKTIKKKLLEKFPQAAYVKSKYNLGYAGGNNLGAKKSCGEYLFFLNPDTLIIGKAIDKLVGFIKKDKSIGIVAPLLLNSKKETYPLQGAKELTPLRAIFTFSFINKLFPENSVARDYWLSSWDKKEIKKVDTAPGTAFVIKKEIFQKAGGFDERFFLFFEENDLCRRLNNMGMKIFINPKAKIIHYWGKSTVLLKNSKAIFQRSRFLYFKKFYGFITAFLTEIVLRFNKTAALILFLLLITIILRRFF